MNEVRRSTDVVAMVDGTQLEVSVFSSEPASPGPVVLCAPAMGVRARSYVRVAQALAGAGCEAVTADLRGHGLSPVRPSRSEDFGYHEMIAVDLSGLAAWARRRYPDRRLALLGHSLGGQLGALYAGSHPGDLDALVLVAACSVHFSGWPLPHRLGVLAGSQAARAVATAWGHVPGTTFRFAGAEARTVMRDWAVNALTGRYDLAGTDLDYEALLGRAELSVLAVTFEGDALGPLEASENLLAKLSQATLSRIHLDRATQGRYAGHFGWLENPEFVTDPVTEWLWSAP